MAQLGVIRQTVGYWETGQTQPNVWQLCKLAEIFGVTTDYLLGIDTQPRPKAEVLFLETGLSEAATDALRGDYPVVAETLSLLLADDDFFVAVLLMDKSRARVRGSNIMGEPECHGVRELRADRARLEDVERAIKEATLDLEGALDSVSGFSAWRKRLYRALPKEAIAAATKAVEMATGASAPDAYRAALVESARNGWPLDDDGD